MVFMQEMLGLHFQRHYIHSLLNFSHCLWTSFLLVHNGILLLLSLAFTLSLLSLLLLQLLFFYIRNENNYPIIVFAAITITITIIIIIVIIIIISFYYYYYYYYQTQSIAVSCSSLFWESGQQPVAKVLTESYTLILTMMLFFSIQVPVSKSLLSPIKLFFVHVLLTSQSKLLQYTSQSELILHLMHLQLLGLQSLPSCPTFLYFPFVHQFISRYGNIYDLTFLLGFLSKNNIWLSSFNLGITLDCKIPQNLVPFVLNNSIWLMLVPVLCSLEFMFFVQFPMNIPA